MKSVENAERAFKEANESLAKFQSRIDERFAMDNIKDPYLYTILQNEHDKASYRLGKASDRLNKARDFLIIRIDALNTVSTKTNNTTQYHDKNYQNFKKIMDVATSNDLNLEAGRYVAFPQEYLGPIYLPHKVLFIRQEYVEIAAITKSKLLLEDQRMVPRTRRVLILGSPGIGKSLFGWFMFLREVQSKNDVAYTGNRITYYVTWEKDRSNYKITSQPDTEMTYIGLFDGKETNIFCSQKRYLIIVFYSVSFFWKKQSR